MVPFAGPSSSIVRLNYETILRNSKQFRENLIRCLYFVLTKQSQSKTIRHDMKTGSGGRRSIPSLQPRYRRAFLHAVTCTTLPGEHDAGSAVAWRGGAGKRGDVHLRVRRPRRHP